MRSDRALQHFETETDGAAEKRVKTSRRQRGEDAFVKLETPAFVGVGAREEFTLDEQLE